MEKIYQVYENLLLDINEVECSRVTDNSYWTLNNMRYALDTNYCKSFKSKDDAVRYLKGKINSKINSVKSTLNYYEEKLEEFKSLYEQPQ